MSTLSRRPRGASRPTGVEVAGTLIGATLGLTFRALKTSPGLLLIALAAAVAAAGYPLTGAGLGLAGAAIYHTQCYRTPYTRCGICHGTGHRRPRGLRVRTAKHCRWCHGQGVRIRWGRAAMNAWRRATYTAPTAREAAEAEDAAEALPRAYTDALRSYYASAPDRYRSSPRNPTGAPTARPDEGHHRP